MKKSWENCVLQRSQEARVAMRVEGPVMSNALEVHNGSFNLTAGKEVMDDLGPPWLQGHAT
jgi:hypothetical protein